MKAIILNIGDEVLSGKVINTNSSYIAKEFLKIGITVEKTIVIDDDEDKLSAEIDVFKASPYDILVTTGGLGPTHDDLTKEVLVKNLGLEMSLNQEAKQLLDDYFGNQMANCNLKQAFFPKEAIILKNKNGTADGAIIEQNQKMYIILVGPPHEMNPMFQDALDFIKDKVDVQFLTKEFIVMGNGESFLEELLRPIYENYPSVYLAPYASVGKIRYQMTAKEDDQEAFNHAVHDFYNIMGDYIISTNNQEIEEVIVDLLKQKNYTISFAESCTGGLLASKIVNVSGASNVFNESFVTYSNEAKIKYLQVNEATISQYGVVSDEVVLEMVLGLFHQTQADICISVSGIAGPGGGTPQKPVGLVHFAIKIKDNIHVESKIFKGNRDIIRTRTALWVLYRLFTLLK